PLATGHRSHGTVVAPPPPVPRPARAGAHASPRVRAGSVTSARRRRRRRPGTGPALPPPGRPHVRGRVGAGPTGLVPRVHEQEKELCPPRAGPTDRPSNVRPRWDCAGSPNGRPVPRTVVTRTRRPFAPVLEPPGHAGSRTRPELVYAPRHVRTTAPPDSTRACRSGPPTSGTSGSEDAPGTGPPRPLRPVARPRTRAPHPEDGNGPAPRARP